MRTCIFRFAIALLNLVAAPLAAQEQHDPAAEARYALIKSNFASSGGRYDCQTDPFLAKASAIPAADTAGIRARLAGSGWRLSTEREIGCRIMKEDQETGNNSHPAAMSDDWGNGRAWWVQRANLDEDTKPDIVAVLTSERNPYLWAFGILPSSGGHVIVPADHVYDNQFPTPVEKGTNVGGSCGGGGTALRSEGMQVGVRILYIRNAQVKETSHTC